MSDRDCYLEAVEYNPYCPVVYNQLASTTAIASHKRVVLKDGRIFDQRGFLVESIRLNPINTPIYCAIAARVYCNLAVGMGTSELVCFHDGRAMSRLEIVMEAIQLCPSYSHAFITLARMLQSSQTVTLQDGKTMTRMDLVREACKYELDFIDYEHLGSCLEKDETVTLPNGQVMNSRAFWMESVKLKPLNPIALAGLASTLDNSETIALPDGKEMSKKNLFLESLQIEPHHKFALIQLSAAMEVSDTVQLGGQTLTKPQLRRMAYEI